VQERLKRDRHIDSGRPSPYILRGLIKCGCCGFACCVFPNHRRARYRCNNFDRLNCSQPSVSVEKIEAMVIAEAVFAFEDPVRLDKLIRESQNALAKGDKQSGKERRALETLKVREFRTRQAMQDADLQDAWTGFASWAAPLVVGMIGTPDNAVRLILPADWRVLGFGVAMALGCTILFGLAPALRASGVKPVSALKGSPHMRARMMQLLIAAQVAFCVLVLFVAGLFTATSDRLSRQHTGFSAERLLTLETVTPQPQPVALWSQVADRLRTVPGVEAVALCEWPLMTGGSWNGFISVNGAAPGPAASYFLSVSPEWRAMMKIPLLQGRDLRASDTLPGSALVNQAFTRQYLEGENPVGRSFEVVLNEGHRDRYRIAGIVGDARYRDMREPMKPTAYFPFQADYARATFIVRTASQNPLAMASALRLEVPRARPGFRVSNIRTQTALIEQHTGRERLLSILALFFGVVALSLAGVGLYGVLDYSVLQRRREIGIRIAIGAQATDIARRLIMGALAVVLAGSILGIILGIASVRFIESLLFEVKATDVGALALPTVTILAVALLAVLPAVVRAVRIDPVTMLRSE
jgi:putative ABC transport system permease protein